MKLTDIPFVPPVISQLSNPKIFLALYSQEVEDLLWIGLDTLPLPLAFCFHQSKPSQCRHARKLFTPLPTYKNYLIFWPSQLNGLFGSEEEGNMLPYALCGGSFPLCLHTPLPSEDTDDRHDIRHGGVWIRGALRTYTPPPSCCGLCLTSPILYSPTFPSSCIGICIFARLIPLPSSSHPLMGTWAGGRCPDPPSL